jgi:hypothetical protein
MDATRAYLRRLDAAAARAHLTPEQLRELAAARRELVGGRR